MDKKEFMLYEAPKVEILEVEVEKGFSASNEGNTRDYGYGGDLS